MPPFGRRRFHTSRPFYSLSPTRLLFSDAGNGATGGGSAVGSNGTGTGNQLSGDSGTPGANTTPITVGFEQFAQEMSRFTDTLGTKFDALRGDVGQLPDRMRPEPPPPAAPDYDTMTNSELVNHLQTSLVGAIEKLLGDRLAPVVEKVNGVEQTHFRATIESQRDKLAETHKDFGDFKPEMIDLAKANPTLSLEQLYVLARGLHPDKAKALDAKYNPPPPPPQKWGGLTPAFGASANTPKLSREQASQEAYREVQSRHPGVLAALESM